MKKMLISVNILILMSLLWTGCQTLGDFGRRDEERQLRMQRRGVLNEAGVYQNDYYQFRVRLPEGWPGNIDDPPNVLVVNPSSHHIARSSLRRQVSIRVRIWDRSDDENILDFIERYTKQNDYEQVLQRPSMVEGFVSGRILFYTDKNGSPFRVLSLFVKQENEFIIVECSAPRNMYDNFESLFRFALDSYKSTREELPDLTDISVTEMRSDPDAEYIDYTVAPEESFESLAALFLGHSDRADILQELNELDVVQAGQRIKIPRTMRYNVNTGDTWQKISHKLFASAEYADWIRDYNQNADLIAGEYVYIPLFYEKTPIIGESYSDVAEHIFGDASLAKRLLEYNDLTPMDSLEFLKVPIYLKDRYFVYTVQRGDSLAWIARWLTGDPNNYKQIADYNNLEPPYRVIINQRIKIPGYLVSDPTVFDRPVPRPSPRPTQRPSIQPTATPRPVSTPTPTPQPISDPGIFDIE